MPLRASYNVKSLGKSVDFGRNAGILVFGGIRGIRGKSENWGEFREFGGSVKINISACGISLPEISDKPYVMGQASTGT